MAELLLLLLVLFSFNLNMCFLQKSGGGMTYVGQPGSERRPGFPRQKANGFCLWIIAETLASSPTIGP